MNRRILFVKLPNFSTELFLKQERMGKPLQRPWYEERDSNETEQSKADLPLVLVEQGTKGTRISASSPEAVALGLWLDMKLADARTIVPLLRVENHDRSADTHAHTRLSHWMMRWSPAVSGYGDDGFLLDTTGCDHLFGGEQAMMEDIHDRLSAFGFTVQTAIANTVGAAVALVLYGAETLSILPADHKQNALDFLPVNALRLNDDSIVLLRRLGLKLIGDVRPIPRAALERRFRKNGLKSKNICATHTAQSVQMRLDQLSGELAEPLIFIKTPSAFRAIRQCPELALEQGAVEIALSGLLQDLCDALEKQAKGARSFQLTAYRADGGKSDAIVRLSHPARDVAMIQRLFRDRLDRIDCGFGVDFFTLEAFHAETITLSQNDMVTEKKSHETTVELAAFADIVSNRVGHPAAMRFAPRTSHVPERAQKAVAVTALSHWDNWHCPAKAPRPLRLLERPEPADVTAELPDSPPAQFVWRKVLRKIIRARGPERILPEWWSDDLKTKQSATFRDYYDVEDTNGLRYWLFRSARDIPVLDSNTEQSDTSSDPDYGWNIHGGRLPNPALETAPVNEVQTIRDVQWFVHGLF